MATLKPLSIPTKYLTASITSSASSLQLSDILDWNGTALTSASFGTLGYIVLRNANNTVVEFMEIDVTTIASSSITILRRGLGFDGDYVTEISANKKSWVKGTHVELGSHVPQLLKHFVTDIGDQTIAGVKTFSSLPATTAGNPVASTDLARKAYVDSVVAGIATAISEVVPGTAGETLSDGNLVYLKLADNRWWKTTASTAGTVENVMLGIAQGAGTAGNPITNGVLIRGVDDAQSGLSAGSVYYAANTAGTIASTPGTTEVTVGVGKSTTELYFDPRFDQQLTEDQQDALVGTSGTPSATNKYVTNDDTTGTGTILRNSALVRFGGTGADGALSISSGTTTIDCANANTVVKNYTSISITGTGKLAFSNPGTGGTIVILKSQGAVTLTSSTAPMIDLKGIGGAGGTGGVPAASGSDGTQGISIQDDVTTHFGNKGLVGTNDTTGGVAGAASTIYSNIFLYSRTVINAVTRGIRIACGSGGGGGGGGRGGTDFQSGGAGGAGGGGLIIECGGAWNFTTALGISVAGVDGTVGTAANNTNGAAAGGGGGGGAGGFVVVVYNTLTANSGTINTAGGAGGAGGNATGGSSGGGNVGAGGGGGSGGAADGGAGGAGGNGGANANGSNGSAAGGRRAGGGGGGGAARWNSAVNGTNTGGTAGSAGASENVLVVPVDYFF